MIPGARSPVSPLDKLDDPLLRESALVSCLLRLVTELAEQEPQGDAHLVHLQVVLVLGLDSNPLALQVTAEELCPGGA